MKMERRRFRIGELAEHLSVDQPSIRLWEKEFGIRSRRNENGQRFYTERELRKFAAIKELVHDRGLTIEGAKQALAHESPAPQKSSPKIDESIIASKITQIEGEEPSYTDALRSIRAQLAFLSDLFESC
jgi:DNA-binding transcriptional MerR regulator